MDGGGKAYCKCEDGWTCIITKTEPSKAGKPFSSCSGPCNCSIKGAEGSPPENAKVYCVCPEGWSCVVSKITGSDAGQVNFECGEGCVCVVEENNTVKVTAV